MTTQTLERFTARNLLPLLFYMPFDKAWPVAQPTAQYGEYQDAVDTLLAVHRNANEALATGAQVDPWASAQAVWEGYRANAGYVELEKEIRKLAGSLDIPIEDRPVQVPEPPKPHSPLYHVSELHKMPPLKWMVKDEILDRGVSVICAPSQSGKSFVTVDRIAKLALAGKKILYVAPEGARGYKQRIRAWEMHHGISLSESSIHFWAAPVYVMQRENVIAFAEVVKEINPDLVVLDTWLKCMAGGDVNSNADTSIALDNCGYLQDRFDCSIYIVHHTNKTGKDLGAVALFNGADVFMTLDNHEGNLSLQYTKNKDGELATPKTYNTIKVTTDIPDEENGGFVTSLILELGQAPVQTRGDKLSNTQVVILTFLDMEIFNDAGCSSTKIVNARGITESTLYNTLSTLKKLGYIRQGKRGDPFYITDEGKRALSNYQNARAKNGSTDRLPKSSQVVIRGRESAIDLAYDSLPADNVLPDAEVQLPKVLLSDHQSSQPIPSTTTLSLPLSLDRVESSGVGSSNTEQSRKLRSKVDSADRKLDRAYQNASQESQRQYDKFSDLLTTTSVGTPEYQKLVLATQHYIETGGDIGDILKAHIEWSKATDELEAFMNGGDHVKS